MSINNLRAFAHLANFGRRIDIAFLCDTKQSGAWATMVAKPIEWTESPEGSGIESPTISLNYTQAQQLMDALWSCGLRPTEGSGSAGSLAATERHLKDMQLIALGALRKAGAIE